MMKTFSHPTKHTFQFVNIDMGNSRSKNVVDDYLESVSETISRGMLECKVKSSTTTMLMNTQRHCRGDAVVRQNLSIDSNVTLQSDCAQAVQQSNDVKRKVDDKAEQMAKTVSQALSLNPGSTKAENINKSIKKLRTTVKSEISTIVGNAINQETKIINKQGHARGCLIEQKVNIRSLTQSVLGSVNSNAQILFEVDDLKKKISQSATAKQEAIISFMMLVVVAVIGVGVFLYKTQSKIMEPANMRLIGAVIMLVLILAFLSRQASSDKKKDQ
jgi:hypothetical protein